MLIHVNKPVFHAGGELFAHVILLLRKGDYRVRCTDRVELVCTETWVQRVDSQYGQSYHRKTENLISEGETLMDDQTIRNGVPYSADLRVSVLRDAIPTLSGKPCAEDRALHRVGCKGRHGRGQGA